MEFFQQQRYRQCEHIALKTGKAFGIGEKMLRHFALTIITGQKFPDITSKYKTGTLYAIDCYKSWKKLRQHLDHTGCSTIDADVFDYEELQKALHFEAVHQRAAYDRRFIATKNRHSIGMCHSAVRADDSVVLLRAARTPFILRKTKKKSATGQMRWKFSEEAYVHDLILRTDANEAQKGMKLRPYPCSDFDLCRDALATAVN
ncbi:hypothetical protein DOTSEDRAFT_27916 [Dothistroma septosporum NZE10]|uniref:Uncharacterized protein n=1 Tax=Dothistroma septosporum (strain NZE10 / CBS 128990) TaxID=675120 RepID=N1PF94_DOTSN|nr:hypothetical protein DOTSEDRAFT_27916 [Dothistroma septosporum NZE10]